MITREKMDACLGRLGMLRRFPIQERVVIQIGKLLNELASSDDEAEQFVSRVLDEHDEWPGPSALRQIHGQVAASRGAQSRPEGCESCRHQGGYRTVFKIVERGTNREETIYPEGDVFAVKAQADKLRAQYLDAKTHVFSDAIVAPCSCAAGQHVAAEARRFSQRTEHRGH